MRAHDRIVAFDHHSGTGNAAAQALLHMEVPAGQLEATEEGADLAEVGPCIEERTQRHVAGDAGEAMEPGEGLGCPACHGRSRAIAQAAP